MCDKVAVATPQRLGDPIIRISSKLATNHCQQNPRDRSAECRDHCGVRMKTDPYLQLTDLGSARQESGKLRIVERYRWLSRDGSGTNVFDEVTMRAWLDRFWSKTLAVDGSECRWARVLAYEPPNRVLLSWDISPRWRIETDPDKTSEWEVRFTAETAHRTRVELEHRKLDRHGDGWQGVRDGVAGDQGWPLYLQRYADLFARAA
jgi:hypothetical protein